jgi:hypothetical protein
MRTSTRRKNIQIPNFSHNYGESFAITNLDNVIVYHRNRSLDFNRTTMSSKCHLQFIIKYEIFTIPGMSDRLHLISIYRSPHLASVSLFFTELQEFVELQQRLRLSPASPLLICGDFNIDLLRSDGDSERETSLLSSYDLFQYVSCHTTDFKSLLDHVWSNITNSNLEVSMQESFWSDHVPVLVSLTL